MCRGGAKAIDTDFKEECMALRIEGHDDDAPDPKATSAAAASPAKRSSGSPAKRGRSPAKAKRQVVGDEDDDQDDAAQVKNFVLEVEHLVKLGCDRGKATAALEKYNDVEKALDACLAEVKTFVLFLDKHCLVLRKTLSLTVVADFVCLQATSAAAQAQEDDAPWGTQETQPEGGDGDGEAASEADDDDDDEANEDKEEDDEDDEVLDKPFQKCRRARCQNCTKCRQILSTKVADKVCLL